jgi:hypothetical protein
MMRSREARMSDLDLGQHGAPVAGGIAALATAITAGIARIFSARDARRREEQAADRDAQTNLRLTMLEKSVEHAVKLLEAQGDLRERLAVVESQLKAQGDLRERVALVEQKATAAHVRVDRVEDRRDTR